MTEITSRGWCFFLPLLVRWTTSSCRHISELQKLYGGIRRGWNRTGTTGGVRVVANRRNTTEMKAFNSIYRSVNSLCSRQGERVAALARCGLCSTATSNSKVSLALVYVHSIGSAVDVHRWNETTVITFLFDYIYVTIYIYVLSMRKDHIGISFAECGILSVFQTVGLLQTYRQINTSRTSLKLSIIVF